MKYIKLRLYPLVYFSLFSPPLLNSSRSDLRAKSFTQISHSKTTVDQRTALFWALADKSSAHISFSLVRYPFIFIFFWFLILFLLFYQINCICHELINSISWSICPFNHYKWLWRYMYIFFIYHYCFWVIFSFQRVTILH